MTATPMTTAAALVSYRSELVAGGVNEDIADEMVRDAARIVVDSVGLGVHDD